MGVVEKKLCNALIADAQVDERRVRSRATRRVLARFKRREGGLWVGGTIVLGEDDLAFGPNAPNADLHRGACSWRLPLESIRAVEPRFGVLTGIVDVQTVEGTRTFRCFGAKAFAARISAQAARRARA